VSKKNRRRGGVAVTPPVSTLVQDFLEDLLGDLWAALEAGDLLRAELETARCIRLPLRDDADMASLLVKMAARGGTPADAALMRLIASLGAPDIKRAASRGLAELTANGIYPAEWVAQAGRATPGEAWRRLDAFGDEELIVVTYRYGEVQHMLSVYIDLTADPVAHGITVAQGTPDRDHDLRRPLDPFEQVCAISLAEARRRIEPTLNHVELERRLDPESMAYLPIARSRLRRLPVEEAPVTPLFSAADRAAAVASFMASPEAAEAVAVDTAATQAWAEILTGYSSRIAGEPPGQVGPGKLEVILLDSVPAIHSLTEAQRRHMRPAVTAWTRWSAAYRGLDEAAAAHLTTGIAELFDAFDANYDNPDAVAARDYVTDLAASDVDLAWLGRIAYRRSIAMPLPEDRDGGERVTRLRASDPADRRAYAAAEFADCRLPDGLTRDEFVSAVQDVVEQLWLGEPPAVWEHAEQHLLGEGMDRHDIIHALVSAALSRRG
jgi:hypothetical protein